MTIRKQLLFGLVRRAHFIVKKQFCLHQNFISLSHLIPKCPSKLILALLISCGRSDDVASHELTVVSAVTQSKILKVIFTPTLPSGQEV